MNKAFRYVCAFVCCICFSKTILSQVCPPNIDFETGSFNGWKCYSGSVVAAGGENNILITESGPVTDRHTMYAPGDNRIDPYGGFPVRSPNGSGYSVRLGNDFGGGQAEGMSYEFTIPANEDKYHLIYNYAVVFQGPTHERHQQPRMEIEIMNMTDNQVISCSSFTFIPFGTDLPGFFLSPNPGSNTPVWCKDWTAVTINLDGYAGKRIRLFFKTADCTFVRHFGYAYIDVNSECNSTFLGATFCPDDTLVNVVAPHGYQNYTWYDQTLTNIIGRQQVLTMQPPPPPGTTIAVKVEPFAGYGCEQVLYAKLADTLKVVANAGVDALSCNQQPVQLGVLPKAGNVYSWSPSAGLSRPDIANPMARPDVTTTYVLTARHDGGGCVNTDTVVVKASRINNVLALTGSTLFCSDSEEAALLAVNHNESIQWFRNGVAIPGSTASDLYVNSTGVYYAVLSNADGCIVNTVTKEIMVEDPQEGVMYPVQYAVENIPLTLDARPFGESYMWNPGIYLSDRESARTVYTGTSGQLYTIHITTAAGCVTVDTLLVRTVKNVDIKVPTAFTPNNDGLNDQLSPVLMGVKELRYFRIYNRWGELLFESKTERPGWDGRVKGMLQSTGAVVWVAEGVGVDGRTYIRKGTSVLIR